MKKIAIIAGAALMIISACKNIAPDPQYHISGSIKNISDTSVYLFRYIADSIAYIDTASLVDGKFEMTGSIDVPDAYQISVGENESNTVFIFLSNDSIDIIADNEQLNKAEITGAPFEKEFHDFNQANRNINFMKRDTNYVNSLYNFIVAHPKSPVSPYLVQMGYFLFNLNLNDLKKMDSLFDDSLNDSQHVIYLREQIAGLNKVAVGIKYTDLSLPDSTGAIINVSDYDGNYRLLDFWASWCKPCRAEFPNLKKINQKYKDKNFKIIGISIDVNLDHWKEAIKDDQLEWIQMVSPYGFDSKAAKTYMITGVPFTVLIDPEGIIIAKHLRGEALYEKLEEISRIESAVNNILITK